MFNSACKRHSAQHFSFHKSGYYYQLLSFDSESKQYRPYDIAWVSVSFKTQSDSVFWDSFNNLNDNFFIRTDTSQANNFLSCHVSKCAVYDSVCLLIKPKDFFAQQFKSDSVPFFSLNDSVVKVHFKIKEIFSKKDFDRRVQNLQRREQEQIESYFRSKQKMQMAHDERGFYWVERPSGVGQSIELGDVVTLQYKGEFLNGRFLERSPEKFEFVYGTPDQLLKGINYVISTLKLGENAKIILPSRLAFGELGSSNGTVPPFTPLVYQIKITHLEKQKHS
jgi:FKBP-type peptidyl-prolyl cis-trans isomerase